MNAIQFIKDHGVEKAREVVEGAPDKTATHYVFRKILRYYSVEFQSWYHDGEWWDSDCHTEQDLIDSYGLDFVVNLSELKKLFEKSDSFSAINSAINFFKEWGLDHSRKYVAVAEDDGDILQWEKNLKRLVESVDLIGKYHSIDHAKNHYNNMREALNQYQYENKDIEDLSNELKQAIADCEAIYGGEHV
ncbi:hypothetical protein WCE00_12550 [Acinetobacter haemolyticus]|uniref:hypothetical protein n=1 Tax=Acinetobacter haemolyticus TaxID=29430 RepID=UPI0034D41B37